MNSNDPTIDPWGTPNVTDVKEDEIPLRITQVQYACKNGSKGHQSRCRWDWEVAATLELWQDCCHDSHKEKAPPDPFLKINNEHISFVHTYRPLGFLITSDLSWANHINRTFSKLYCGFLYRYFKGAGPWCLAELYMSIVLPILDYGSPAWDPSHKKYIVLLERVPHSDRQMVERCYTSSEATRMDYLGQKTAVLQALRVQAYPPRRVPPPIQYLYVQPSHFS